MVFEQKATYVLKGRVGDYDGITSALEPDFVAIEMYSLVSKDGVLLEIMPVGDSGKYLSDDLILKVTKPLFVRLPHSLDRLLDSAEFLEGTKMRLFKDSFKIKKTKDDGYADLIALGARSD